MGFSSRNEDERVAERALQSGADQMSQDCESRVRVSDLAVKPSPVRLGDLLGNRFNVVLRMVPEQAP